MRPTFEKTVDILVKAYLNDTLTHWNCFACAVGNLIAAGKGFTYNEFGEWNEKLETHWQAVIVATRLVDMNMYKLSEGARDEIDSTGYSAFELARIEGAFESADSILDPYTALLDYVSKCSERTLKQLEQ